MRSIKNHGGINSREIYSHRNQNCPYTTQATKTSKLESGFKRTVKKAGKKTKDFVGKKTAQVKEYRKQYKSDADYAFDMGFKRGWDAAYVSPHRASARSAAARGFKKGINNQYRSDKH